MRNEGRYKIMCSGPALLLLLLLLLLICSLGLFHIHNCYLNYISECQESGRTEERGERRERGEKGERGGWSTFERIGGTLSRGGHLRRERMRGPRGGLLLSPIQMNLMTNFESRISRCGGFRKGLRESNTSG